jgi:hypothetical protein
MALTRALPQNHQLLLPTVAIVFLAAACGHAGGPAGPSPAPSVAFSPGPYRFSVDKTSSSGPGTVWVSLCIGDPGANTGFAIDVALSIDRDGAPRLKMPNDIGMNSGTLTAEFLVNQSAISGRMRGWAVDRTMRRIVIDPPASSPDALLSGIGGSSFASGDFSGGFSFQTPDGFMSPAPCTPLGWTLTPLP